MPSGGELGISARVDQCSLGEHFEEQCVVLQIEAACRGEMDAQIGLDASTELPLIRLLDEELSSDVAMAREFRSEEHTSELQSIMRISYAVFCLINNKTPMFNTYHNKQL